MGSSEEQRGPTAARRAEAAAVAMLFVVGTATLPAARAQQRAVIPSSARSRSVERRLRPRLRAELAARGLRLGAPVLLRIFKEERELELWLRGPSGRYVLWRTWPICAVSGTLGPKLREGDGQAPEGFYAVTPSRMNPRSHFHLSFGLGFPNAYDRAHRRTGSALMVHGRCVSAGCYAMTDPVIEEIWTLMSAAFRRGQRRIWVHAFPARLTPQWLQRHRDAPWYDFWQQLAAGYEAFEQSHLPPRIFVRRGRYVVRPARVPRTRSTASTETEIAERAPQQRSARRTSRLLERGSRNPG